MIKDTLTYLVIVPATLLLILATMYQVRSVENQYKRLFDQGRVIQVVK